MTWPWATCFSLLLCVVRCSWAATVSGNVDVSGSKDRAGVVVWLEPVHSTPPATPPQTTTIAHRNKTFVPHVTAVRTGSKVRFPNLDPFFHNAFSSYEGQEFDIGLHPPGSAREVTFHRPGIVRIFCNIHPTMSGVIVVVDTPWFAVSDSRGTFLVNSVAPGEYMLKVFYERALPATLDKLERTITVGTDDLVLPALLISEAGYVAQRHKNKFGKDYPAVIIDQYPGARR